MTAYVDRSLTLNGVSLHYQDWGDAAAPPILFVHGLTQQSHVFDAVTRHLAARFRCIAMDVRGRGESDWAAPETYNLVQYAKDALALLDALEIEAADYVGTSMGGLTAMAIARRTPERLKRTVINDIGPEIAPAGLQRIAEAAGERGGTFRDLDDYIERGILPYFYWMKGRPQSVLRDLARWSLKEDPAGGLCVRYDPAVRGAASPDPTTRQQQANFLWEGFRALRGPLLLVHGAESDLLAPETVQAMQAAQPALRVVEVPGTSHAPTLDEPEALSALESFFA